MKKLTVVLVGAFFSLAALGQDLLQCVSPDVVKGVLYNGRAEAQASVTATLPAAMSGFTAPAGFQLIGSSQRLDGAAATVAFRTSLDSAAAHAAMLGAFEAEGWVTEEQPTPTTPIFVLGESAPASETICRDSERRGLNVQELNGRRYLTVYLNDQPSTLGCNVEDPRRARAMSMMSGLTQEAPTLQLPEGTTAANGSGRIAGGGGGSGDTYQTGDQIRIAQSASSFMGNLGAQMSAQGWAVDSSWSGTLSKGGRWTKTAANGLPYWATIELVDVGNDIHDLSFRLMMPPN